MSNIFQLDYCLIAAAALWLLSIAPTAFEYNDTNKSGWSGASCFFLGALAFIYNMKAFWAWLGNIFFFLSLIFLWFDINAWLAFAAALIAFSLAFFALKIKRMLVNEGGDERNVKPGLAYYLWHAAFLVQLLTSVFERVIFLLQ
jgi:hypothetical protein